MSADEQPWEPDWASWHWWYTSTGEAAPHPKSACAEDCGGKP